MKNKIAIFTTDLYKGGVSESTRKLVNFLSQDNHVDLIIYDNTPIIHETTANRIFQLNLPLAANFAKSKFGRILKKIFRIPCLLIAILRLIIYRLKHKPDVIYSMMYIPNIVNVIASKILPSKTKIIISERQDPRMDLDEKSLITKLLRIIYPYADRVHANSFGMICAIEEFYSIDKAKIYHLDNFFDFSEVIKKSKEPLESSFEVVFAQKVIITSGRLSKQKGHWHLLYAFKHLINKDPSYRLVILGDGELHSLYNALINELSLNDFVYLLGNVKNPHKYVSKAHLFIFPSIWESFGNSLVEAMCLGLPVISTSCKSGPDYIIENGLYGYNLGVLGAYDIHAEDIDASNTIINSIEFFNNSGNYDHFRQMSYKRSLDFSIDNLADSINKLFQFEK